MVDTVTVPIGFRNLQPCSLQSLDQGPEDPAVERLFRGILKYAFSNCVNALSLATLTASGDPHCFAFHSASIA